MSGRIFFAIGASLFALAALDGCRQSVDLAQIRALAQTVRTAEPSYAAIAEDLDGSCGRMVTWHTYGKIPLTVVRASDASANTAPALSTVKDPLDDPAYCSTQYAEPIKRWKTVSALLTGYFEQLGNAAADDSKIDYGFSTIVADDKGLSADESSALSGFATDITNGIFAARRRELTATQATKAKAAVDELAARLSKVADESYSAQLDLEQDEINTFFRRNFSTTSTRTSQYTTIAIRDEWRKAIEELRGRRDAEKAYVASLKALADGNDGIVAAASKNDFDAVFSIATATIAEFNPDVVALQKALK